MVLQLGGLRQTLPVVKRVSRLSQLTQLIEGFVVKIAIVHFFKIEIKYDAEGKFHPKNDGNIGFL